MKSPINITGKNGLVDRWKRLRPSTRIGCAVVLVALIVRGAVAYVSLEKYVVAKETDRDAYGELAETLASTGVYGLVGDDDRAYPTAFRPPLYPFLLSRLVVQGKLSPIGVAVFHTLLGCVTALCVYRASRPLLNETSYYRGSLLAAGFVIFDPILLNQSRQLMTETLAAALASIIIWWWVRHAHWSKSIGSATILGGLLVLAYFCRPIFLVWGFLIVVCVYYARPYLPAKPRLRMGRAALVGASLILAMAIWALRNQSERHIGHLVWTTTHGGYTLLLGNNPSFYDYLAHGKLGTTWDSSSFENAYEHRHDPGADVTTEAFWRKDWPANSGDNQVSIVDADASESATIVEVGYDGSSEVSNDVATPDPEEPSTTDGGTSTVNQFVSKPGGDDAPKDESGSAALEASNTEASITGQADDVSSDDEASDDVSSDAQLATSDKEDVGPIEAEVTTPAESSMAAGPPSRFSNDEHGEDQRNYAAAWSSIARQPLMFVYSCVVRVYRLWTPLPVGFAQFPPYVVWPVVIYYLLFYVAFGFGIWKLRKRFSHPQWWPAGALVVALTLVHLVYWSNMRMRAPAIPLMAIVAAAVVRPSEERDK